MRLDWYKIFRQLISFLFNRPTIVVDDLQDFCFTTELGLKEIMNEMKDRGWEINHKLQHTIKTIWGTQLIGARKFDYTGHQYHVRVFDNGDGGNRIYCHYEWMPEVKPYKHYVGDGCVRDCSRVQFLDDSEEHMARHTDYMIKTPSQ